MFPKVIRQKRVFEPFNPLIELFDLSEFRHAPNFDHGDSKGMMKIDVKDEGSDYGVYVDLPGCKKEDIKLEFNEGVLSITASRTHETEKQDDSGYIFRERFCGECSRTIRVGDVKEDDIKAKFEDGVLKLTFPKKTEPEKKLIAIE